LPPVARLAIIGHVQSVERIAVIQALIGPLWDGVPDKEVDLIFRQLDLGDPAEWRDVPGLPAARYDALIRLLERLPDDRLDALAQVVLPGYRRQPPVATAAEAGPWLTDYVRVFVSHTHEHCEQVGHLKTQLERRGIECFVAHADITPSDEWRNAILLALRTCEALLVWLTPDFHESQWTDQEIGHCLAREVPILTLRFDETDPYGYLERFQAMRGDGFRSNELPNEVFRSLARQTATSERVAESVVHAFQASPSYGDTSTLIDVAEVVPRFSPEQLDGLEVAIHENHEVRDYGRVDRLVRLISRHRDSLRPRAGT
jgi:hypothetical protein